MPPKANAAAKDKVPAPAKKDAVIPMPSASVFLIDGQKVNEEIIEAKKKEYLKLTIKDTKDTAGYNAVVKAIADFRTTRTTLDKVRKEGDKPIRDLLDLRKKNADKLMEMLQDGQTKLEERKKVIDDEKDRLAEEKKQARQKIIDGRKTDIVALGYVFNPDVQIYALPDNSRMVNLLQIESFEDGEFAELLEDLKGAAADYTERKESEERIEKRRLGRVRAANELGRNYAFTFDGIIDKANFDKNAEEMDEPLWDAYWKSMIEILDAETDRRHKQKLFDQLKADRAVQIKDLYYTYQLPIGFFPDTDAVAAIEDPGSYETVYAEMKERAIADKERRENDAKELEELRAEKNQANPLDVEEPQSEEEPQQDEGAPDIIIEHKRLDEDTVDLLPTKEIKEAAAEMIFRAPDPVKVSKSDIKFITEQGHNVSVEDKFYSFLPFYFEIVDADKGMVVFHPLERLPEALVNKLQEERDA